MTWLFEKRVTNINHCVCRPKVVWEVRSRVGCTMLWPYETYRSSKYNGWHTIRNYLQSQFIIICRCDHIILQSLIAKIIFCFTFYLLSIPDKFIWLFDDNLFLKPYFSKFYFHWEIIMYLCSLGRNN